MTKKRSLHVMIDAEVYEKLRYICFYERTTLAEVIRNLLGAYLEEKGIEEAEVRRQRRL